MGDNTGKKLLEQDVNYDIIDSKNNIPITLRVSKEINDFLENAADNGFRSKQKATLRFLELGIQMYKDESLKCSSRDE